MKIFIIAPHMRLHEWVAEEKGYFADEKLDYEFRDQLVSHIGVVSGSCFSYWVIL